jgi:hypothetical protein
MVMRERSIAINVSIYFCKILHFHDKIFFIRKMLRDMILVLFLNKCATEVINEFLRASRNSHDIFSQFIFFPLKNNGTLATTCILSDVKDTLMWFYIFYFALHFLYNYYDYIFNQSGPYGHLIFFFCHTAKKN